MDAILQASIAQGQQRFVDELFGWLRIPSISARTEHTADMLKAAQYLQDQLLALGCQRAELLPTQGYPVVFAERHVHSELPTVLVYGHYDVQPPDPLELWTSPPFEPQLRDGRIYARGACDDKGQLYMHVKALEVLQTLGPLPCNVKFFVEGEEEVGSANLEACLLVNKDLLAADVLLISDTSMLGNELPSLTIGLRGLAYLQVSLTGPNRDLHSGVYGGAVANPLQVLCQLIASLQDTTGKITIPGFYDDVVALTPSERAAMAQIPFSLQDYQQKLGLSHTAGEAGYSVIEQTTARPSLDLNGIWGGYTGQGAKTVLPAKAHAKISMRLVPNQQPEVIASLLEACLRRMAPPTVQLQVEHLHGGKPFLTDTQSIGYKAAEAAMLQSFGKKPIPTREGGSIPILALFENILHLPTVLMGFGLDVDAIHSPNESYGLFNFTKGIETIVLFHQQFARLLRA